MDPRRALHELSAGPTKIDRKAPSLGPGDEDCPELVVPGAVSARTTCCEMEAGVSTAKLEITWGLPSSNSWKSSFCRFATACPSESRTTTRTGTRLTRDCNGTGASWASISGESAEAGACCAAGAGVDGSLAGWLG